MNRPLNILELFAGSRSIGKVAEKRGHNVISVDKECFDDIDIVTDIELLTVRDIMFGLGQPAHRPFIPDVIHSGTPCTTYSIAAISHHRPHGKEHTPFADKCDAMNVHVWSLIDHFKCLYTVENPRGMLRKMPFMQRRERCSVTYCSYNDDRMKPTDIWSNNIRSLFNPDGEFIPRQMCRNNNPSCDHQRAPRGSATGTQGRRNNYERSLMPEQLCIDLIIAAEKRFENTQPPFNTFSG